MLTWPSSIAGRPFQRVEKVFSPRMVQEYTVGPAGFRALCARKPGAFLETGSLSPPLAAHRPFPLLGFPAHTLPYRRGESSALSTDSHGLPSSSPEGHFL